MVRGRRLFLLFVSWLVGEEGLEKRRERDTGGREGRTGFALAVE